MISQHLLPFLKRLSPRNLVTLPTVARVVTAVTGRRTGRLLPSSSSSMLRSPEPSRTAVSSSKAAGRTIEPLGRALMVETSRPSEAPRSAAVMSSSVPSSVMRSAGEPSAVAAVILVRRLLLERRLLVGVLLVGRRLLVRIGLLLLVAGLVLLLVAGGLLVGGVLVVGSLRRRTGSCESERHVVSFVPMLRYAGRLTLLVRRVVARLSFAADVVLRLAERILDLSKGVERSTRSRNMSGGKRLHLVGREERVVLSTAAVADLIVLVTLALVLVVANAVLGQSVEDIGLQKNPMRQSAMKSHRRRTKAVLPCHHDQVPRPSS